MTVLTIILLCLLVISIVVLILLIRKQRRAAATVPGFVSAGFAAAILALSVWEKAVV